MICSPSHLLQSVVFNTRVSRLWDTNEILASLLFVLLPMIPLSPCPVKYEFTYLPEPFKHDSLAEDMLFF